MTKFHFYGGCASSSNGLVVSDSEFPKLLQSDQCQRCAKLLLSSTTVQTKKKTIVVMNRHIITENRKTGSCTPPIRASRGKHGKPAYHSTFEFNGRGRLIYDPDNPLPCGATAWLELDES